MRVCKLQCASNVEKLYHAKDFGPLLSLKVWYNVYAWLVQRAPQKWGYIIITLTLCITGQPPAHNYQSCTNKANKGGFTIRRVALHCESDTLSRGFNKSFTSINANTIKFAFSS